MIALPASGMLRIPCPARAAISVLFPDPGPPVTTNRRSTFTASIPPPDLRPSRHRLVTQQDIPSAERPRPGQFQVQFLLHSVEHRSPFTQNNGIHHDLELIDQTFLRQLRNNAPA